MAKPASLPEWATSGTIVVPNPAKRAAGHVPSEEPAAEYENWAKNLSYQWLAYLDSGALEGNHSIAGNLALTGTGTLTAAGLVTANAGAAVTGNSSVAGKLTVDGGGAVGTGSFQPISSGLPQPSVWGTAMTIPHAVMVDSFGGLARPGMHLYDEFDGDAAGQNIASGRWDVNVVGTSTATYLARHRARLSCGANAADAVEVIANNAAIIRAELPRFRCHAKVDAAAAEDMIIQLGFEDYYFNIAPGTSPEWQFVVTGDANSPFDLNIDQDVIPQTEMIFQFFVAGARTIHWMMLSPADAPTAGDLEDWLVGSGTLTTNADIPAGANQPRVYIESVGAGSSADLDIDFVEVFTQVRM